MKKYLLAALLVLITTVPAIAKTTIQVPSSQPDFKDFSTDFGMALSYQPVSPAERLGGTLPGFDAGVEASVFKLDKSAPYFSEINSNGGNLPDSFLLPRVHVQVGLPIIPIDLGVSYTSVPNSQIKLTGAEVKYAVIKGGVLMPAVALRGAYTKLSGVDVLDLTTKSLDLSISKGFLMLTPYIGVGNVWITSTPKGTLAQTLNLQKEDISKTKEFVGLKFSLLPVLNLVAEGDFSTIKEYTLRLNLHF